MLTCQYVLWKRENTEVRVIRKRVCVWAHKLSLSGPYDLKQKQIQFWLDESAATCRILPPRVIQTLVYGRACTCGCVSHDVHGVHQTLHHYCCVSQRSYWTARSVSTPLFARFVLTWPTKENMAQGNKWAWEDGLTICSPNRILIRRPTKSNRSYSS